MKARSSAIIGALVVNACGVNAAHADTPTTKKEMVHTMLLQIYEQRGSKEVAPEYQALLAMKPNDDKLHYRYGMYLEKAGDDRAVKEYREAAKLAPAKPDYWGALGNAHYRNRNYSGAAGAYKRAVECGGGAKYQQLYQNMMQYLQQQRDYQNYQQKLKDDQ